MHHHTITSLCNIAGGQFLNQFIPDLPIEHLLLDSRQVVFPTETLFFAMVGNNRDGHDFIDVLYEQGVRNFFVTKNIKIQIFSGANFVLVADATRALQQIAAHHRQIFSKLPVVGITGSNGKTIVKEWLFQLLQPDFDIVRSPKSYNSQVGVPLSVWHIAAHHTLGIFEAGVSKPGEMINLAPIINCQTGIFTNIGAAHSEGFSSDSAKIEEKLALFEHAETLIFCCDYTDIQRNINSKFLNKTFFTWSKKNTAGVNLWVKEIATQNGATQLNAVFRKEEIRIQIPFTDHASIENAIHCWALMLQRGYANEIISHRMWLLEPVAMRLELKAGINNCVIVNDSYNSDLTSLTTALQFVEQQNTLSQLTIILSDIFQSGLSPSKLYATVANLLAQKKITRFIGIGTQIQAIASKLSAQLPATFFDSTEDFLAQCKNSDFSQETILLKGARTFAFERIANRLSQKSHKTVLEINLDALVENLRAYRCHLQPRTKMMAMLKASAYGSGSHEIARLLENQQVSYFAVAYADEGIELRQAEVRLPILVLNPEEESFDAMLRYRLEPQIYSLSLLKNFILALKPSHENINIHLKIDTGMRRLGFEKEDLTELSAILRGAPQLRVQSIFSHLAASENPAHDDFTEQQVHIFSEIYQILSDKLGYRPLKHVLNSEGIVRFPQYQFDMVRLGIGLYGVSGSAGWLPPLRVVSTLKATVSQIKNVAAGETVGYGRRGRAEAPMRIATLSIGYADGLLRAAGNGRFSVGIGGGRAPIVGNICMDMCMVDVTRLPHVEQGDEAMIFGDAPRVEELAAALQTIPYEIFTTLSERVKRVYFQS